MRKILALTCLLLLITCISASATTITDTGPPAIATVSSHLNMTTDANVGFSMQSRFIGGANTSALPSPFAITATANAAIDDNSAGMTTPYSGNGLTARTRQCAFGSGRITREPLGAKGFGIDDFGP